MITYSKPVHVDKRDKQLESLYPEFVKKKSNSFSEETEYEDIEETEEEKEKKYLHSLTTSMNRSKNELYNIARSNNWDYFITLTFNRDMVEDRTDYDHLLEKVRKWLDNIRQRKSPNLKYLLVPEMHKRVESNGKRAWHFHGLIANCDGMTFEELHDIHYSNDSNTIVYSIKDFKLGFTTATRVQNNDAVTRYISKYITKSLVGLTKGKRRYISSKNCAKPKQYCFMDNSRRDLEDFGIPAEHDVHLEDLVDMDKCTWHKQKTISSIDYSNTYTYYEFKNENTDIERFLKYAIISDNDL